jgi:hypothetical protein
MHFARAGGRGTLPAVLSHFGEKRCELIKRRERSKIDREASGPLNFPSILFALSAYN